MERSEAARQRRGRRRLHDPDPVGPRRRPRSRADPEPAGDGRRAPSSGARRARARAARSSSNRATRARCTTARCCSATAPASVNPYLAFETLDDMIRQGMLAGRHARAGGQELHQGAQQGHPQGDVQDGHLDAAELLRRADLRGDRPRPRVRRQVLHVDGVAHRRHRHRRHRRGSASRGTTARSRRGRSASPISTGAASTSGAATASTTCSTPTRCSSCSTRRAAASTRSSRSTRGSSTTRASSCATLRGLLELKPARRADPARRGRAGRVDRQALRDRRDVVRLDQPGGARDAGDRDEPPRRQVEHRRGRRGSGALHAATPNGDSRRSADQAGGVGALRRDERVPGQRRRSADQDGAGRQARRGRPAARATRSIRGSRRCGTRRPASG